MLWNDHVRNEKMKPRNRKAGKKGVKKVQKKAEQLESLKAKDADFAGGAIDMCFLERNDCIKNTCACT